MATVLQATRDVLAAPVLQAARDVLAATVPQTAPNLQATRDVLAATTVPRRLLPPPAPTRRHGAPCKNMAGHNIVAQLQVEPIGKDTSMGEEVRRAVETLERKGLKIDIGPMGTSIESTSLDDIMDAAKAAHRAVCERAPRVVTHLTIDERLDEDRPMEERVAEAETF